MAGNIDPNDVVRQFLAPFRELLQQLDNNQVAAVNTFWRGVRNVLREQENEIRQLRQNVQLLPNVGPTPRPVSANSVIALRDQMDRNLQDAALLAPDASGNVEDLNHVPMLWARDFLNRRRRPQPNELGCWVSGVAPAHPNGYCKVNLRNTPWPPGSGRHGTMRILCFEHQLAIVAKGEADRLRLTTHGDYHVSHLCHNPACSNPDHVIVEPGWLNRLRNSCKHSFIIEFGDGTVLHPCTHWREEVGHHCILPRRRVPRNQMGKYLEMTVDGPRLRDGHLH